MKSSSSKRSLSLLHLPPPFEVIPQSRASSLEQDEAVIARDAQLAANLNGLSSEQLALFEDPRLNFQQLPFGERNSAIALVADEALSDPRRNGIHLLCRF